MNIEKIPVVIGLKKVIVHASTPGTVLLLSLSLVCLSQMFYFEGGKAAFIYGGICIL